MIILELMQQIAIGILMAYISFTNSLASHIETFFPETGSEIIETEQSEVGFDRTLHSIAEAARTYTTSIPRVLLDNRNFQSAATVASMESEQNVAFPSDTPVRTAVERSLVNVYCQYRTDQHIRTTTGTGFFVNPKGVILTNAHVAQFLLLEGVDDVISDAECVIRTGNPATPQYRAELLYISPTWIAENASLINDETPRGTGERDYALLYVAESTDSSPLPDLFPSVPTNINLLPRTAIGMTVLSAGYPAEKLIQNGSDTELAPVVDDASIGTLYTFGSNYADIFSVSSSSVGEQGASGGPIVDPQTGAIGLIVTRGDTATEGAQSLRALTLSYVDRAITEETGFPLSQNMLGDVTHRAGVFREAMVPFLTDLLTKELEE